MADPSSRQANESLPRNPAEAEGASHPDLVLDAAPRIHKSSGTLKCSFGFAFTGLAYAIRTQRNMRIHLATAALVVALGIYLGLDWTEWAVLGLTVGFVLVAELFNTVAEAALDAATPYYHPLVKIAKDVAAAAVLVTAMISVLVGLCILAPPLLARLTGWFSG